MNRHYLRICALRQAVNERELAQYVVGGNSSWLGSYLRYARSLTDAPALFHVGSGLVVLAGAVGSSLAWKGGGGRENWPNLYVLLLAPSGSYRKSTSVDLACSLLVRACPGTVMDNEFSVERFVRSLAEHPTAVLKSAEFSALLERMKASYMGPLKPLLTELYDCVPEYSRRITGEGGSQGEKLRIERPALSIIAASTTDWLVASINEMDLRSGFLPRFVLFPCSQKEPEPQGGYWSEPDPTEEKALISGLAAIRFHGTRGRLTVSFQAVRDELVAWNGRQERRAQIEEMAGLYSRLGHYAAKLCALLAISDGDDQQGRLEISQDQCQRAIALLEWIVDGSERTFEEHLVFEKFERLMQKALRFIRAQEGAEVDQSALLKHLHLKSHELKQVLETLRERGEVDLPPPLATGGRLKTIIRALDTDDGKKGKKGEVFGELSLVPQPLNGAAGAEYSAYPTHGGALGP